MAAGDGPNAQRDTPATRRTTIATVDPQAGDAGHSSHRTGSDTMKHPARFLLALLLALPLAAASATVDFHAAAEGLDAAIRDSYAYPEEWPGGVLPASPQLDAGRQAVHDADSLLHYAEDRMASLADHHAITGSSFADSWAVVPTYADLWIVVDGDGFAIDAVRDGSPAQRAGVHAGDRLVAVDGLATAQAVAAFWGRLGLDVTPQRAAYAARVLAAGRRDRPRHLGIADGRGRVRQLTLPSLYTVDGGDNPAPVSVDTRSKQVVLRFGNSLGDDATIAAFDDAMAHVPPDADLVIDLRDTPSGGNTSVARAVMGWFVREPHGYQVHNLPSEERDTGIPRQWVEQVLPRAGKYRSALPTVWVGRWTGSMGEGLAIGFASMGAHVRGTRMAGLNGSVDDIRVGDSGLTVKLPTERLMTTTYLPREDFVPEPMP